LQFESLEQRVTMSAGLIHAAVGAAAAHVVPVKGMFTGGSTSLPPGSLMLSIGGLSGELGKVQLTGVVGGQISGHRFVSGFMQLSNSQGSLVADLGRGTVHKSGKTQQLKLLVIVTQATGAYSDVAGSVGKARFTFTAEPGKSVSGLNSARQKWYPKTVEFTVLFAGLTLKADQALLTPSS
jgi:hypothetical protein